MVWRSLSLVVSASIAISLSACQAGGDGANQTPSETLASVSMLFAPPTTLAGEPNLYEFSVATAEQELQSYRGDLPRVGEAVYLFDLPAAAAANVTGGLFKDRFDRDKQTHSCESTAPIALVAGEASTVELSCVPVVNTMTEPVSVFMKVAKIEADLAQSTAADFLGGIDWSEPRLFSYLDKQNQLVTVKTSATSLTLYLSGRATYRVHSTGAKAPAPLVAMMQGQPLELDLIAGEQMAAAPEKITLTMSKEPAVYAVPEPKAVIFVNATDAEGVLEVEGTLVERDLMSEFTVVAYNVENLFDQTDDDRNSHYGDYRITPNDRGFSSNYGEPIEFNGETVSFTDVKIAGIRKALMAIDPAGPEVVGLQEIESPAALEALQNALADLGYTYAQFGDWGAAAPNAVSTAILSKFPISDWRLIDVAPPADADADAEPPRRIFRVELDVLGHPLVIYNNHWKSKGGPESRRIASAEALEADVQAMLLDQPNADYIVLGDLNSNYNEKATIEPRHNDSNGRTGINDVIRAQGDELAAMRDRSTGLKYNLHFELNRAQRRTAYHGRFGWSSMDHIILGSGLYTGEGIVYVDNSFEIASADMPELNFLFNEDGTTNRWQRVRRGNTSVHAVGGYADHVPLFARFRVDPVQDGSWIRLFRPGRADRN